MKANDPSGSPFFLTGSDWIVVRLRDACVMAEGTEAECRTEAQRRSRQDKDEYAVMQPRVRMGRKHDIAIEEIPA